MRGDGKGGRAGVGKRARVRQISAGGGEEKGEGGGGAGGRGGFLSPTLLSLAVFSHRSFSAAGEETRGNMGEKTEKMN